MYVFSHSSQSFRRDSTESVEIRIQEMNKFEECLRRVNKEVLNEKGLNLLSPKRNAWLFVRTLFW